MLGPNTTQAILAYFKKCNLSTSEKPSNTETKEESEEVTEEESKE